MPYSLAFLPSADKEWHKLGATVRAQFVRKLCERLEHPRVEADALRGLADHDKIKLRRADYRLVYRVDDPMVTITVVALGGLRGGEAPLDRSQAQCRDLGFGYDQGNGRGQRPIRLVETTNT